MTRRRSLGFTLIEMLVVIAIIGVLAAILLPAVNRVRDQAKKVYCENNLSQFGKAVQTYLMMYNGYWPVSGANCRFSTKDPYGFAYYPMDLLCQFVGRSNKDNAFSLYAVGMMNPREVPRICLCPCTNLKDGTEYDNRDPLKNYFWNAHVDGLGPGQSNECSKFRVNTESINSVPDRDWSGSGEYYPWVRWVYAKISEVTRPSDLVIMGDTHDMYGRYHSPGSSWMGFAHISHNLTQWPSAVSDRHMGGGNYLFADGHVAWLSFDFLKWQVNMSKWLLVAGPKDRIYYPESNPLR